MLKIISISSFRQNSGRLSFWARLFLPSVLLVFVLSASPWARAASSDAQIGQLEEHVWLASNQELLGLEGKLIRIIQIQPRSAIGHYLLSLFYLRTFADEPSEIGRLQNASRLAEQAIELDTQSSYGYVALAYLLDFMGHTERSFDVLNAYQKKFDSNAWRIKYLLAHLHARGGESARALQLLQQTVALKNTNKNLVSALVMDILKAHYRGQELLAEIGEWQAVYPTPAFDLGTAEALASAGSYQKAHQALKALIKNGHEAEQAMLEDAIILYSQLKQPRTAVNLLTQLLDRPGFQTLTPMFRARVFAHLAAAQLTLKEFSTAEESFVQAMHYTPDDMAQLQFIRSQYQSQQSMQHFAQFIRKLNEEVPGNAFFHALLGETLTSDLKDHESAIFAFVDAITLEPNRSDLYNSIGLTFYRLSRFSDALQSFEAANQIDPTDAASKYNVACILNLMGRSDEALGALKEAINLDPRLGNNAKEDQDFKTLFEDPRFLRITEKATSKSQQSGH